VSEPRLPRMAELTAGSEFAGYRIEGLAGRGGMGVVYRAMDIRLRRPVAIKVIAPAFANDPLFRVRFERESQLAAMIRHPNVITVFGAGEHDGQLFVVMEYVAGTDLRAAITSDGQLDPGRATAIVSQVAGALDAAHARDLVHRDVKPANVLLASGDRHEEAYLTDFGLTKHTASDSGLTGTGMFVGTIDYAAPEQIRGDPLDARTDVYSLGCVLYHSLTGAVPYPRPNQMATLYAHAHEPPPLLRAMAPEVTEELERVVATAMAKNPADRYRSAGDLGRAALAASADRGRGGQPLAAFSTMPPPPPPPPPTRVRAAESQMSMITLPGRPTALCLASGSVWVALPDEDLIVRVDERTGAIVGAPIEVGRDPVELAGDESLVIAANGKEGTLTRIDPVSGTVLGEQVSTWAERHRKRRWSATLEAEWVPTWKSPVPTSELMTAGTAIALDHETIWIALSGTDEVMRIEWVEGGLERFAVSVGRVPLGLTIAANAVWVANYADDSVSSIDLEWSEVLTDAIAVPRGPIQIAELADRLWVLSSDALSLTAIDPASGRVIGDPVELTGSVESLAAGSGRLWLLDDAQPALVCFDPEGRATVERVALGGTPNALAVGEDSVWITTPDDHALVRVTL
jgi:serine/threonine protein kinase